MLEAKSQNILSDLIYKCILGEKTIELSRISLCEKYDFSPDYFASMISPNGFISSRDLKQFLNSHRITAQDSEIYMVIKQFSCMQDGRLTIEDFYQIFLPSTNPNLRSRSISRPLIKTYSEFTMICFLKVLQEELKLQSELEKLKEELYKQKDFSVYGAFETLARGKQVFNEVDIAEFMKKFRRNTTSDEIDAFLRRVDLEDDIVVSYNEFLEFIIPFVLPEKGREEGKVEENTKEEIKTKDANAKKLLEKEEIAGKNESIDEIPTNEPPAEQKVKKEEPKGLKAEEKSRGTGKSVGKEVASKEKLRNSRQNSEGIPNLSDHLLDVLLAVRFEELKKQELAMIPDFSFANALKLISNSEDSSANSQDFARFLSVDISEISLLFRPNQIVRVDFLIKLLQPFEESYKDQINRESNAEIPSIGVKFLKNALSAVLTTEKLIQDLYEYKASSVASTRKESDKDLDADSVEDILLAKKISLHPNQVAIFVTRLEINS
ncbi:hypothetical protein SteCoe_19143 [Stentor coeruleus]|uniref:EF-hand domain-containing protein n=1 Tax=Stentor coeruleus TaxID=5963 RepID=A0A1R2BUU8_9CILI|nr:hypothetical protein SteCoe_19143 [Stentor coeruleus]